MTLSNRTTFSCGLLWTVLLVAAVKAHADWGQNAQFAPDGKTVLAHQILWRLPEGREIRRYDAPFCALSFGGRFVVTGDGKTLEFWNVTSGASERRVNLQSESLDLRTIVWPLCALVSGGHEFMLAAEEDYKITFSVFDAQTGKLLRKISTAADKYSQGRIALDGKTFLLGIEKDNKPLIGIWSVTSGVLVQQIQGNLDASSEEKEEVALSCDGKILARSIDGESVRLVEVATGKVLREISVPKSIIDAIAFTPDKRSLLTITLSIVSEDSSGQLWDIATGKQTHSFEIKSRARSVAVSPDNRFMASEDGVWEIASQNAQFLSRLDPGHDLVWNVAFSSDGKYALSDGHDTSTDESFVRVWDAQSGKLLHLFAGWRGAFAPDGSTLALAGEDGALRVMDLKTGQEIRALEKLPHAAQMLAFSNDGKKLIVECNTGYSYDYNDWKILVLDVAGVLPMREWTGIGLRLSPDHRHAAFLAGKKFSGAVFLNGEKFGGGDSTYFGVAGFIEILDLNTDVLGGAASRRVNNTGSPIAVANSGNRLLVEDRENYQVYLWNIATDPPVRGKQINSGNTDRGASFSPLGSFLLLPFSDALRLMNVDSGEVVRKFKGNSATFSPDGKTVLVGTRNGQAMLYKIATGELIQNFQVAQEKP